MFGPKKHKVLISSVITSIYLLFSCESTVQKGLVINGETQGTTYSIIISDDKCSLDKKSVDSLLAQFDMSLSTYINESVISRINNCEDSISIQDKSGFLKECYRKSLNVFRETNGMFDPSVFPLVDGWGFMNNMETPLEKNEIDSILNYISFEPGKYHNVVFSDDWINFSKKNPKFKLDFNAIAQGMSVDVLAEYLRDKGIENYYIEIGGEIAVKGKNREGVDWIIGVDSPHSPNNTRELENIMSITDKSIATSGNYRKYYEVDGVKYSHTLNPKTGFPVNHSLLSATVVVDDCASADAFATAFMVMGTDATLDFVKNYKGSMEVYLLFAKEDGSIGRKMSKGFESYISK